MNQQRSRRFKAAKERLELEAEAREQAAKDSLRGETLGAASSSEASFDSNCITPGTPFMGERISLFLFPSLFSLSLLLLEKERGERGVRDGTNKKKLTKKQKKTNRTNISGRLAAHLRFFVRRKMADDPAWCRPRIMLSGHDVPGEGEHKIMEAIR
jgi:5'-3' exonuclease